MTRRPMLAVALATLLAGPGCFYTGDLNERPRAEIEKAGGPYHYPGDVVEFDARKSSDAEDGAGIECSWKAYVCPAADDPTCMELITEEGEELPQPLDCGSRFPVPLPWGKHDPIVVDLKVRDGAGAEYVDTERIEVANRPPDIAVAVPPTGTSDHNVVTLPIEITAVVTDLDQDELPRLEWALIKPRGASGDVQLEELPDPPEGSEVRRFTPDVPGIWRVEVTADDGFEGGLVSHSEQIAVSEDAPPCVGVTAPGVDPDHRYIVRREEGPRTFAVLSVLDDLDPYPRGASSPPGLGDPTFAWQIASPDTGGVLVPLGGAVGPEVTIDPSVYAAGDLVDLRIEIADRNLVELPCAADQPTCALEGDECLQRVTWGVEIR